MNIAFVGGGNMAGALIGGMLDAGFDAAQVQVLEVDAARNAEISQRHRVGVHGAAGEWLKPCEVVVLAVKPQQMREAAAAIQPYLAQPLVLSIAAGVHADTIAGWLANDRVVRAMPNMPALIRAGITGAFALMEVSTAQKSAADRILAAVGSVIWLDDEAMLDAVTAVSGSGPAYVFYFIEALQDAARDLGFDAEQARALSLQTFVGATQLAAQSQETIAALREKVASKGGTTAAALASLDRDHVDEAIARAIRAAAFRARELGG